MRTTAVAALLALLLPAMVTASVHDFSSGAIPEGMEHMFSYEPDLGVDESFYTGVDRDGKRLPDGSASDDSDFEVSEVTLARLRAQDRLAKPLNVERIIEADEERRAGRGFIPLDSAEALLEQMHSLGLEDPRPTDNSDDDTEWDDYEPPSQFGGSFYSGMTANGPVSDTEDTPLDYSVDLSALEKTEDK